MFANATRSTSTARYGASGSGRTSGRAPRRFVRRLGASPAATTEGATSSERLLRLVLKVYETVAGSDRGFSYRNNADKRRSVVEAVDDLLRSSPGDRCTVDSGLWRLVYSTNFGSDEITRGGTSSQPPGLGQVYQRVDRERSQLDNLVEVSLPLVGTKVTLCLQHELRIVESVQGGEEFVITFSGTKVSGGGIEVPTLPNVLQMLPDSLRPQQELSSASFENVFSEEGLRISKGDRGELRIYCKEEP
ncbi:putative plastid-lipid associated fibrillin [Chloropicon primus]|nr:putative plastid-lipid associated fibrillin [Chloropicon primus]